MGREGAAFFVGCADRDAAAVGFFAGASSTVLTGRGGLKAGPLRLGGFAAFGGISIVKQQYLVRCEVAI
jgi:hypothetical protein